MAALVREAVIQILRNVLVQKAEVGQLQPFGLSMPMSGYDRGRLPEYHPETMSSTWEADDLHARGKADFTSSKHLEQRALRF
jgi:hypothetical protein